MKHFLLLATGLALSTAAFADGTVTGKITDAKTSEPLIGVVVSVKGNGALGTATDIDGNFQLKVPAGKYELEIKYLGYQTKEIGDVDVKDEATITLNSTLAETRKSKDLGEVVIRATLKKENINSMILLQKTTNTVAQVVSAEAIRRSPDRNTGEVLKRVSGASIQEGKYLVVRGLADRYNAAMLNGALLSSTEPDRKTFSFDLFPSAIVDNIVINKAAVPELPGEFAGGLVQVNTRDIPTQDFLNIQLGSGSNSQTLGKQFSSNNVGKTDFLGIDDGTRGLPSGFPGNKSAFENQSLTNRAALSADFKNNFNISKNTAPLNAGGQLSGGLSRKLGKGRIGFVGALNYAKNNRISETQRYDFNDDGSAIYTYNEQRSQQNILWGALGNVAYTAGTNKISWKNLFSINSNNQVTLRDGRDENGPYDVRAYELAFTTNRFFSSQLSGEHVLKGAGFLLKGAGLKLRWNGSYTNLNQNIPDLRRVSYQRESNTKDSFEANVPQGSASLTSSGRFFSRLNDNVVSGSVDAARPYRLGGAQHTVKAGYLVQTKNRDFTPRALGYVADRSNPETNAMLHQDISTLFGAPNIGTNKLYLNETTNPQDKYKANSLLNAGYLQFENQVLPKLQATLGVRVESYQQTISYANSIGAAQDKTTTVTDPLPSANLKYSLNDKTNLRLAAFQSVIRPEFRELAPFAFYNFELLSVEQGNSNLKRTKVSNADLRYEIYPAPGEFATVGVFYKHFANPIERFFNSTGAGSQSLDYGNTPSAYSYGAEAEFRKSLGFLNKNSGENSLLANTYLFSNVALIKNEVSFATGSTLKTRPMQGQSNYVINAGISMDYKKTGSNFSLLVNRIGRRIFIVGNGVDQLDIWEAPRTLLDAQFTQRLFRNGEVKISVSDILNQYARFYEDTDGSGKYEAGGKDFLRIQTRFGTAFGISFAYKFPHEKKQPVGSVTIP